MRRILIAIILLAAACKGETVVKDKPETLAALDGCKKSLAEKDKRIDAEEAANADLWKSGAGSGGVVTVVVEGTNFTIKPLAAGEAPHPIADAATIAASREFVNLVERSRGSIQKCYTLALKKHTELQTRGTITLTVSATFAQSGAYQDASFSPSLGDPFDSCMKTLASKWTLPTNTPAMTFRAPVTLTPS